MGSKKIQATYGYHVVTHINDKIDELHSLSDKEHSEIDPTNFMLPTLNRIRARINHDVCANSEQISFIDNMIDEIIDDADKKLTEARLANRKIKEAVDGIAELTQEVNSYRFKCTHCLDDRCPLRDPNTKVGSNGKPREKYWYEKWLGN